MCQIWKINKPKAISSFQSLSKTRNETDKQKETETDQQEDPTQLLEALTLFFELKTRHSDHQKTITDTECQTD